MTPKNTKGFTLVELVLAMALFISILIATTAAFIGINRTYSKGVIRKQLSEAVQRTVEDITKTLRESGSLGPVSATDTSNYAICDDVCYVWKKEDGSDNKRLLRTVTNKPADLSNAYEIADDRYTVDFIKIEELDSETRLYRISGVMRTADNKNAFEFTTDYLDYILSQDPSKIRCKGTTEADSVRGCNLEKFDFVVNTKAGS